MNPADASEPNRPADLTALRKELEDLRGALQVERARLDAERAVHAQSLNASQARLASLLSLSADWVWEQDEAGRLTYVSDGAAVATGRPLQQLLNRRRQDFEGFECDEGVRLRYETALARHEPFRDVVYGIAARDGSTRYLRISGEPLFDDVGRFIGFRGVGSDVTATVRAERQWAQMARFDLLTELPNRAHFIDELERAIARARRSQTSFALCFVDLDGFKQINDTLGHAAGDEVLRVVAQRLKAQLRESDFVARLGGDEFVALLPGESAPAGLATVGRKLLNAIAQPIDHPARALQVSGSIGVALYPTDSEDSKALVEQADAAMYQAKQEGKNRVCFYTQDLARLAARQFALELDLRQSFSAGGFELHFQPRFEIASGTLCAMEALMRWNHPQRGQIPPSEFIALAEQRGMILMLGRWVLDAACRQLRRWRDAGLSPPRCALNISAHQIGADTLLDDVGAALARHQIEPASLELEFSESMITALRGRSHVVLQRLHDLGVQLSIDDFGIGTSSLALLGKVPAHRLKVDQSLVGHLPEHEALGITRAAIALAHGMGLRAVAVGVETADQLETLRQLGCEEAQGYLLGRPMPADAFAAQLSRQAPAAAAKSAWR